MSGVAVCRGCSSLSFEPFLWRRYRSGQGSTSRQLRASSGFVDLAAFFQDDFEKACLSVAPQAWQSLAFGATPGAIRRRFGAPVITIYEVVWLESDTRAMRHRLRQNRGAPDWADAGDGHEAPPYATLGQNDGVQPQGL